MSNKMTSNFAACLEELLGSEFEPLGIGYSWEWDEDNESAVVTVVSNANKAVTAEVQFRFLNGVLQINMYDWDWKAIRVDDTTVKYLWMYVAPKIWDN